MKTSAHELYASSLLAQLEDWYRLRPTWGVAEILSLGRRLLSAIEIERIREGDEAKGKADDEC